MYDLTNAASYGSRNMIAKSSIIMNIPVQDVPRGWEDDDVDAAHLSVG